MKRALFFLLIILGSSVFAQNDRNATLKLFLQAQQNQIKLEDEAMAQEQASISSKYSAEKNKLISDTALLLKKSADDIALQTKENAKQAEEQVEKIEKLKFELIRVSINPESSKEDLEALSKNLSSEYNTLESQGYVATSLSSYITLRASSFNKETNAWNIQIYSEFFKYTTLLNQEFQLTYHDLVGKRYKEDDSSLQVIDLYDNLFRKTVPVVYIKVYFRVFKWKNASEYGFIPTKIELRNVMGDTLIKNFSVDDLFTVSFFMYPQLDIRSETERQSDVNRSAALFNDGVPEPTFNKESSEKSSKSKSKISFTPFSEQKGRRSAYFVTDFSLTQNQLEDFKFKEVTFNSVKGFLSFGIGKFGFLGGSLGFDYNNSLFNAQYSAGINGGVNIVISDYLRPYVELGFDYHTDYKGVLSGGAGLDVMFGKLLLNANYRYNIPFSFEDLNTKMLDPYHTFAAGIGLTW